jgi:hypothetical protein
MRIATLNTWKNEGDYARRLDLMTRGLAALSPDIICLQECFAGAGTDTAAVLAHRLGLVNLPRPSRAKLRLQGGAMVPSTSGLAILSRLPAVAERAHPLVSHPADGERIAQRLDLAAIDGHALRILNLHLTHLRGAQFSALRASQLTQALDWAYEGLVGGLVVAGDLNAAASDPALAPLNARVGFEMTTLLGARSHGPQGEGPAIDHLLLQQPGGWRVASRFRALDQGDSDGWRPSDHAAVVIDLIAI